MVIIVGFTALCAQTQTKKVFESSALQNFLMICLVSSCRNEKPNDTGRRSVIEARKD